MLMELNNKILTLRWLFRGEAEEDIAADTTKSVATEVATAAAWAAVLDGDEEGDEEGDLGIFFCVETLSPRTSRDICDR